MTSLDTRSRILCVSGEQRSGLKGGIEASFIGLVSIKHVGIYIHVYIYIYMILFNTGNAGWLISVGRYTPK